MGRPYIIIGVRSTAPDNAIVVSLTRTVLEEVIEVPPSAFQYKDSLISNLAYTKFEAAVS